MDFSLKYWFMDLLKDLNEAQRAAVEYIDGPSLVIGAGYAYAQKQAAQWEGYR